MSNYLCYLLVINKLIEPINLILENRIYPNEIKK